MLRHAATLLLACTAAAQDVVCIGDSITAGSGDALAWPAVLAQRHDGQVTAMAAGGTTLLRGTDKPFIDSPAWRMRRRVEVDVAVVMLGTNDTVLNERRRCWERVDQLEDDTTALLDAIAVRFDSPRVLLCGPPPMFPETGGLSPERAQDLRERAPRLAELARRYRAIAAGRANVDYVDLTRALTARRTTDGVHPDPFGAEAIAEHVAMLLRIPVEERPFELPEGRDGAHRGFRRLDFALPGGEGDCTLLRPHFVASGRPWLWRDQPFEDTTRDLYLLDRGLHVAYGPRAATRYLGIVPTSENPNPASVRLGKMVPQRPEQPGSFGAQLRTLLRELELDELNPAERALPSLEYRSGAGWGGDSWMQQVTKMRRLATENPDIEVVFFGDSITQGLTGAADRVTRGDGGRPIDRFPGAISLGLSGDRTEHLSYRVEHGALAVLDPKVIVLQVGVNNINAAGHSGQETAGGLTKLVRRLCAAEPQATILICGPFPCGREPDDPRRTEIDVVHQSARDLSAVDRVLYMDLRALFLDASGRTNERMAADAIHITRAGQEAWMGAIARPIEQVRR